MQEATDYKKNDAIKKAWNNMLLLAHSAHKEPLKFLTAGMLFFDAIHSYHNSLYGFELGGDDFGTCIAQLSSFCSATVDLQNAKKIFQIVYGCNGYTLHVTPQSKRHLDILNAGSTRDYIQRNELQSWFYSHSRYFPLILMTLRFKTSEGIRNIDQLSDPPDFHYASLLIDCSEDYFIEITINLMHLVSEFICEQETSDLEKKMVKEILDKGRELLYERNKPLVEKYEELARLCISFENNASRLHRLIGLFLCKIPPGFIFEEVNLPNRKNLILGKLKETRKFYSQHRTFIPSQLVTFVSEQCYEQDTSIENKINQLPYIEIVKDQIKANQEDYFFQETKKLIDDLCSYVIHHPEANIIHDRHHVINQILKKVVIILFERETPAADRFRELAIFLIEHDYQDKGELHKIIQKYVSNEPVVSEYSRLEVPVKQREIFVQQKLKVHKEYYQFNEALPSLKSDLELENELKKIPALVMSHLDANYQQESKPMWKFVNWFLSIFICQHPLIKTIKQQTQNSNVSSSTIVSDTLHY